MIFEGDFAGSENIHVGLLKSTPSFIISCMMVSVDQNLCSRCLHIANK